MACTYGKLHIDALDPEHLKIKNASIYNRMLFPNTCGVLMYLENVEDCRF